MKTEAILDHNLAIRLDLDPSWKANIAFQSNPANWSHLANQLLIYERVVVPTHDCGIVPILIGWFGLDGFREVLDSDALFFLKKRGLLGYVGNGNAVSTFIVEQGTGKPLAWWAEATYTSSAAKAVDLQLFHACPFVSVRERADLVEKVAARIQVPRYTNEVFISSVANETYRDIMGSPDLTSFVIESEHQDCKPGDCAHPQIDLIRLRGVTPRQMRLLNLHEIRDSVDLVLRVAEINLEVLLASTYGGCDIATSQGAERLLASKLLRSGFSHVALESFGRLLELNRIPDVGASVAAGEIGLKDLWRLRQKRSAREFREWFRSQNCEDPREIERQFVRGINEAGIRGSFPTRVVRFALTTLAGMVSPVTGALAAAVDSFFVDRWLDGFRPRLFLDALSRLPYKH